MEEKHKNISHNEKKKVDNPRANKVNYNHVLNLKLLKNKQL